MSDLRQISYFMHDQVHVSQAIVSFKQDINGFMSGNDFLIRRNIFLNLVARRIARHDSLHLIDAADILRDFYKELPKSRKPFAF